MLIRIKSMLLLGMRLAADLLLMASGTDAIHVCLVVTATLRYRHDVVGNHGWSTTDVAFVVATP